MNTNDLSLLCYDCSDYGCYAWVSFYMMVLSTPQFVWLLRYFSFCFYAMVHLYAMVHFYAMIRYYAMVRFYAMVHLYATVRFYTMVRLYGFNVYIVM